jgi:hypothetical protein
VALMSIDDFDRHPSSSARRRSTGYAHLGGQRR